MTLFLHKRTSRRIHVPVVGGGTHPHLHTRHEFQCSACGADRWVEIDEALQPEYADMNVTDYEHCCWQCEA